MSKVWIHSTLTCPQQYTTYAIGADGIAVSTGSVIVKGGAHITQKNLVTPYGVATEVTDEQLEQLRSNQVFVAHERNGFVKVDSRPLKEDELVSDLEIADESAPLTAEKIKQKNTSKAKANKAE